MRTETRQPALTLHELDECLELLHRVVKQVITSPQTLLAGHGLGRAHHRALFYIRREQGIAVGDLAARMAVTNQAAHKTLRDLLEHGLIRSAPNPRNRRSRQLTLTREGTRLEASLSGLQREIFARVAGELGRARMAQWSEVSDALAET